MSLKFTDYYPPDPQSALQLLPEDMALPMAQHLADYFKMTSHSFIGRPEYLSLAVKLGYAAGESQTEVLKLLTEAWMWLERELMLAPYPHHGGDQKYLTERGKKFAKLTNSADYRNGNLIPPGTLHPALAGEAEGLFRRGSYDLAVLAAFKAVEVAVREKAGLEAKWRGEDLMFRSFRCDDGKSGGGILVGPHLQTPGEQQGVAYLFAGAMDLFKNPSSHRYWLDDAIQCAELIYMADYLLRELVRHQRKESAPTV